MAVVGGREFVAIVATCMAMAALSIDLMLPAFPDMRAEFGLPADSTEVSRVITAFFFGLAVGQLFYGPLSDRFGRKRPLYAGLAIYCVSAVAAALMPTLGGVVACRFVCGLGAAAPRSLALAMIRDTYEGERMARTMSHVMATFILVPVFAPGLGSAIMIVVGWRVVFWIPVLAAVGLAVWITRLPETLPVERRRSVSPAALLEALRAVGRSRQTVGFGVAVTFLFGIMTSYIGSSQIIIEEVFGEGDRFPLIFGLLACMLGLGALLSGRMVMRVGLSRLIRFGAVYVVTIATFLAVLVIATDGRPSLLAFGVLLALLLPGVTVLVPNCNTAAMTPVPHIAGMAAAVLGTLSTAGGALLGLLVDNAFDGTVRPFAYGALVYAAVAATAIIVLARHPSTVGPAEAASAAVLAVSVGDVATPGEPVSDPHGERTAV
jgi:DHA1 family bicyclomycin/chloramphenicol resistance-like MFS transporter